MRLIPALACALALVTGCEKTEPIVTYVIPTNVPEELRAPKDRMLAAIVPKGDQVWFFKVTGPEDALGNLETKYRDFVSAIEFDQGVPVLKSLPEGWRRGGEKPMRYATIDVETPSKQLNISISKLGRQEDWDGQVKMNVNRWRGQLGLDPSDDKWAEGVEFDVAAADAKSVWVDLVGEPSASASMSPPFAGGAPFARSMGGGGGAAAPQQPDSRLSYDPPQGWRELRATGMRMAAFNTGPEESPAELTVIQAGGDLRGNVARWLGQVRPGGVPDEVVDKALADAQKVDVDGRPSQRFLLTGEEANSGTAIDATIVPFDDGSSLFVKMTGPAETVRQQSDAIAAFLESLDLNL